MTVIGPLLAQDLAGVTAGISGESDTWDQPSSASPRGLAHNTHPTTRIKWPSIATEETCFSAL